MSTIPLLILAAVFIAPIKSFSFEKFDFSFARGRTDAFSETMAQVIEKNPAFIDKEKTRVDALSVDFSVSESAIKLIPLLGENKNKNRYEIISGLYGINAGAFGQVSSAFNIGGLGLAAFFGADSSARVDNPVFPSARLSIFSERGGIIGYSHNLFHNLSIGASLKGQLVESSSVGVNSLEFYKPIEVRRESGLKLNASVGAKLSFKDNYSENTFAIYGRNILIRDEISSIENDPFLFGFGFKRRFTREGLAPFDFYIQTDFIKSNTALSLGFDYHIFGPISVSAGLSDLKPSVGLRFKASIFEIKAGFYNQKFGERDQYVFSTGFDISSD